MACSKPIISGRTARRRSHTAHRVFLPSQQATAFAVFKLRALRAIFWAPSLLLGWCFPAHPAQEAPTAALIRAQPTLQSADPAPRAPGPPQAPSPANFAPQALSATPLGPRSAPPVPRAPSPLRALLRASLTSPRAPRERTLQSHRRARSAPRGPFAWRAPPASAWGASSCQSPQADLTPAPRRATWMASPGLRGLAPPILTTASAPLRVWACACGARRARRSPTCKAPTPTLPQMAAIMVGRVPGAPLPL